MKMQAKKLHLRRETITALDPEDMKDVAGGRICLTSGQHTSDPTPSVCICS
jgi:natural product precursor